MPSRQPPRSARPLLPQLPVQRIINLQVRTAPRSPEAAPLIQNARDALCCRLGFLTRALLCGEAWAGGRTPEQGPWRGQSGRSCRHSGKMRREGRTQPGVTPWKSPLQSWEAPTFRRPQANSCVQGPTSLNGPGCHSGATGACSHTSAEKHTGPLTCQAHPQERPKGTSTYIVLSQTLFPKGPRVTFAVVTAVLSLWSAF